MVPKVVKNGLGHPSTKNFMVPLGLSDGPNTHPNIDTNPRIYPPVDWSRSISTVDRITLMEEYGRYRRSIGLHSIQIAVDRGSRIKYRDNLWSILSTTPVQFSILLDCSIQEQSYLRPIVFDHVCLIRSNLICRRRAQVQCWW